MAAKIRGVYYARFSRTTHAQNRPFDNPSAPWTKPIKAKNHYYFTPTDTSGTGSISGVVREGTTPVSRRVQLYDAQTDTLLDTQQSAADGTVVFGYLPKDRRYYVIAFDKTNTYNSVIASNIAPV